MNAELIRKNVLENQAWLERALLAVEKGQLWHTEQDAQMGSYMVRWIRQQRARHVKIGECLTGDMWPAKARYLMQQYTSELVQIAYTKALADVARYTKLAKEAKKRANELRKELDKELSDCYSPQKSPQETT